MTLREIHEAAESNLTQTQTEHAQQLGEIHTIDDDLRRWINLLPPQDSQQLTQAQRELAFSEYAVASGLYRQALGGVRLFLELGVATVYFSAHELKRRQWMSDRRDFSWSEATNEESGVLSSQFVKEFFPELQTKALACQYHVKETYRNLSQFIHGKHNTSQQLPDSVAYNGDLFNYWHKQAQQAGESVLLLLLIRYGRTEEGLLCRGLDELLIHRYDHLQEISRLNGFSND